MLRIRQTILNKALQQSKLLSSSSTAADNVGEIVVSSLEPFELFS